MVYEEYMKNSPSSRKNEISKVSTFLKVDFSVCRKQHWIINLRTSAHIMLLNLCIKKHTISPVSTLTFFLLILPFASNIILQSLRLAFFFRFSRIAVTLQANSLVLLFWFKLTRLWNLKITAFWNIWRTAW